MIPLVLPQEVEITTRQKGPAVMHRAFFFPSRGMESRVIRSDYLRIDAAGGISIRISMP